MLDFQIEWLDAPGVTTEVLAATWARLKIVAHAVDSVQRTVSRLISGPARSERDGIYGSVFPLAEWIVENWWFLLNEACRLPELPAGRHDAGGEPHREWTRRHNLLGARHGGALPDLSLFRDGKHIVAHWFPDPDSESTSRPVRFVGEGDLRLEPHGVEQGLERFVEEVLSRLDGAAMHEAQRLRSEWAAVCHSRSHEKHLCAWAASMGLDPYDAQELPDNLADEMTTRLPVLESELQTDLTEVASASSLSSDLKWIEHGQALVGAGTERAIDFGWNGDRDSPPSRTAHELGYRRADQFRRNTGLGTAPIDDLLRHLNQQCQWPWNADQPLEVPADSRIGALLVLDSNGLPHVVAPHASVEQATFRLARALYFALGLGQGTHARLVTRAYTWDQRASRAFAAELLAPAVSLRASVQGGVPAEQAHELARRFHVSDWVIEHQLKNHGIGWLEGP